MSATPPRTRSTASNASLSTPQSNPSASTGHLATDSAAPIPLGQLDLKALVLDHLKGRVWEFGCDDVIRMIMPSLTADQVRKFNDALAAAPLGELTLGQLGMPETPSYPPLVEYLNSLITIAQHIRDMLGFNSDADAYWQTMFCRQNAKATRDGIHGAHALKPDLLVFKIGALETEPEGKDFTAMWGYSASPCDKNFPVLHIELVFEVKKDWSQMLAQLGTYARACFYASPLRRFVVCLGINHVERTFSIFVFHAGGVAVSTPIDLEEGQEELVRFLLSVLLWRTVDDAGIVSDGIHYTLPSPVKGTAPIELDNLQLLHRRVDLCGRRTYVARVGSTVDGSNNNERGRRTANFTSYGAGLKLQDDHERPATELSTANESAAVVGEKRKGRDDDVEANPSSSKRNKGPHTSELRPPSQRLKDKGKGKASTWTPNLSDARRSKGQSTSGRQQSNENYVSDRLATFRADVAAATPVPEDIQQRLGAERRTTPLAKHTEIHARGNLKECPTEAVIKLSWQRLDKWQLEALALADCSGRFGLPSVFYTLRVADNKIFLPSNDADGTLWSKCKKINRGAPIPPDRRVLCATVTADVGISLECCRTPWELARALLDCQLGWLGALQCDILHRDVSIGNLLLLKVPATRESFQVSLPERYDPSELAEARTAYNAIGADLRKTLDSLDVGDKCTAIMTDFDLASRMNQPSKGTGHLSGTVEFMSARMLESMKFKTAYRQSVRDDLWSFFNVAVWAILHNKTYPGKSSFERVWGEEIRERYAVRDAAHIAIIERWTNISKAAAKTRPFLIKKSGPAVPVEAALDEFSPLLKAFIPILHEWRQKLLDLPNLSVLESPVDIAEGFQQQYDALECVRDFAVILEKYRGRLESAAPTASPPHSA
ncbi:hypothetical protein BKA62DRAFT_833014 [Auriculariales sp. MPI-PUGE-AT-0066]|nr:hypothetical protein BKA62DRAFT_833014 [Auriculariales sp. MPI-PUGE-AT-0066]